MGGHVQDLHPRVRTLRADDLGIGVAAAAAASHASTAPDAPGIDPSDPLVVKVVRLTEEFGGVIFTGPPGTSKTFLAAQIGELLTDKDESRLWFVQFHASYQYEDFMYGFVPNADGTGFTPRKGPFLLACQKAEQDPDQKYVVVIDELSRADVGRVFGEALTYVERSKRGLPFTIASGEIVRVPQNLVVLATMNPQDRGVDEVDAAFERRFAKVAMEPNPDALVAILEKNGVEEDLRDRVLHWFRRMNGLARKNPSAAVGHAYFVNVVDRETLQELWEYQLQFLVGRSLRLDEQARTEIEAAWERIFEVPAVPVSPPPGNLPAATEDVVDGGGAAGAPQ